MIRNHFEKLRISTSLLTLLRVFVTAFAGVCTLLITHHINQKLGVEGFATYSQLVAISAIIPISDLGSGNLVFNLIVNKTNPSLEDYKSVNSYFNITLAISLILIFFILLLLPFMPNFPNSLLGIPKSMQVVALVIIIFTLLNIPFSIGSRILFARQKFYLSLVLSLLISMITCALIFFLPLKYNFLAIIPMGTMLFVNIAICFILKFKANYRFRVFITKDSLVKLLKMGFYSSTSAYLFNFLIHIPKFKLGSNLNSEEIGQYTMFTIFLVPFLGIIQFSVLPKIRNLREINDKVQSTSERN